MTPRCRPDDDDVAALVTRLGLGPLDEGGWYKQTWTGADGPGGRPVGTAIYYLLAAGERSHWHRLDIDEVWHFTDGSPMEHRQTDNTGAITTVVLGRTSDGGDGNQVQAQVVVPAGCWQTARPLGPWSAACCSTAPGFTDAGFDLAPPDWEPADREPGSWEPAAGRPVKHRDDADEGSAST